MTNLQSVYPLKTGTPSQIKINLVGAILLVGFALSVVYHYIMAMYAGNGYPYNTFLFVPSDRFNDFFNPLSQTTDLNPYFGNHSFRSNYYPFSHLLLVLFTALDKDHALYLFLAIFIVAFVGICIAALRSESKVELFRNVFILSFLTYPVLFTIDRGNLESVVFLFLYFALLFILKNNMKTGSILLSCAIAMKAYPAVFFTLLISLKKYKHVFFVILVTICLSLFSLLLFSGGFWNNADFILSGFHVNDSPLFQSNNLVQRGVSLFSSLKIYLIEANLISRVNMDFVLKTYMVAVSMIFFILSLAVVFMDIKLWEKVFLLVCSMLLFPHISGDYKLIHLFIPLFLFIHEESVQKTDYFYAVLFGLLLIPKDYYFFQKVVSDSGTSDISIAVPLNALIMLVMIVSIIMTGLRKTNKAGLKSTASAHLDAVRDLVKIR